MTEIPFVTSETDLAVYLILSGINLLEIQYEPRQNGKKRGIFVFEYDPKIEECRHLYESGQASINMADFKQTKSKLFDRLMQELP